MSDPSPLPKPKVASSFATLLSSFTRPAEPWDDSALPDDVAIISYEQALHAHRSVPSREMLAAERISNVSESNLEKPISLAPGKNRKTASITIRLTKEEEAQLHDRAAAAQLSISAYLRSCIFEAESLRAQVKQALAQMQTPPLTPTTEKPSRSWTPRFLSRWSQRSPAES